MTNCFLTEVAGVALAGGVSRRYGEDKAAVRICGRPMIERVLDVLAGCFGEVLVVVGNEEQRDRWRHLPAKVICDLHPGKGVLGGIYTGLDQASTPFVFATACDMPWLAPEVVRFIATYPPELDVVVPVAGRRRHALHSRYSKRCLDPMAQRIEKGELKADSFYPSVRVCEIPEEELRRLDPELRSIHNVNRPEDL